LLRSRLKTALTAEDATRFEGALRIYPKRDDVRSYNIEHLEALEQPCLMMKAEHEGVGAKDVDAAEVNNLQVELSLMIGSRVMLTENLWTEVGLVNGALGTVFDVAWDANFPARQQQMYDEENSEGTPFVILVKMDRYTGPQCFPERDQQRYHNVVPVFKITKDFLSHRNAQCKRTQ
ncbi:hypothetical protein QBC32DRAFT_382847, partial [Pseudoneurospora amorphoporcata]